MGKNRQRSARGVEQDGEPMTAEDKRKVREKAEEDAVLAMQCIVRWKRMTDMCEERSNSEIGCKGCPYEIAQPCARPSTTAILTDAAALFERYLVLWGKDV